jgi:DNA polymerase-3 subunit beta
MAEQANGTSRPLMEIIVDKSDLLRELSAAQGVVERKGTIPILSNFLLETVPDKLLITGSDMDLSLRTSCHARIQAPGSCTVPGHKLYDYVRLLRDGPITIKLLENEWVQIRSGRSNTKMVGMKRDSFPALPLFPAATRIQLPAPILRDMITRTIFSISQEESRYMLNGALLLLRPEGATMVATDGHRLAHIETVNCRLPVAGEVKVVVPKKAMTELYELLNSPDVQVVHFAKDDSTLFFIVSGRLLTCRQLSGKFPDYTAVLPHDLDKVVAVPAPELSRAIQRVSQFSDEKSNAVRLKIEKDQMRISSSSEGSGESEDSIETSYSGDPLLTGFNSRYLLEFMRVAGDGNVNFRFKASASAGEFLPEGPSGQYRYRYIVMPMQA